MLEYNYDKEILKNLQDYISRLESDINCRNKIIDFFYKDERLAPIFNKKATDLMAQGVTEIDIIVKATVDCLLDKISDLEKSYNDMKNKTINPKDRIIPVILTKDDITILNILYKRYHRKIYLYALCSAAGITEEYVNQFLNKLIVLGYYKYDGFDNIVIGDGYLTNNGIKFVREINKYYGKE